jgi:hypothetical protein
MCITDVGINYGARGGVHEGNVVIAVRRERVAADRVVGGHVVVVARKACELEASESN